MVWPSSRKRKPGSASTRSSTASIASTRRARNSSNGRYHSRSQWKWETRKIVGTHTPHENVVVAERVERGRRAGRDDQHRERFFDQRGSGDRGARAELRAVVHGCGDVPVAPERFPGALLRRARVDDGAALGEVIGLRRSAACDDAHAAHDRLLATEAEAAFGFVLIVEALGEVEQPGLVECSALRNGNAHVEVLARVTHLRVQRALDVGRRQARGLQFLVDFLHEIGHEVVDASEVDLRQGSDVRADEVDHVVGHEHAQRAECGRGLRHDDAIDAEFAGDRHRVHCAVAAVRDQRKVAGVGAVAGEHLAGRVRHVGVHDAFDAPRRMRDVEAERLGDVLARWRGARASTSRLMRPPAKPSVGRYPSTASASVTVGRAPPRP